MIRQHTLQKNDVVVVASSLGFTEGPIWTSDEHLRVTSVSRGVVHELSWPDWRVLSSAETGGGPNGLAETPDGTLWVAQNGGATVASSSKRTVKPGVQAIIGNVIADRLVTGCDAPNDIAVGPDGRIWFTDPGHRDEAGLGQIRVFDPRTGAAETAADGIDYPNGLAWDADGETLFVAETRTGGILRYRLGRHGLVAQGVFATLPEGGGDGLALDIDGNLLVAVPRADSIVCIAPSGVINATTALPFPSFPTNLCFAGPERDVLAVTVAKGGKVVLLHPPGAGRGPKDLP